MILTSKPNIKDNVGRTLYWCKFHEEYYLNECSNCVGDF